MIAQIQGEPVKTYTPSFISKFLFGLFLFDVTLTSVAFFAPQFWYTIFHGAEYIDPQALLQRCGANWAAFALLQFLAYKNWQQHTYWLAIIAGVRLSDIFTDLTCAIFADSMTLFGLTSFYPMSLVNLAMGVYFLNAFKHHSGFVKVSS